MQNKPFLHFLTGAMVKLAFSWTLHTLSAHAGNRSLRRSQWCPEAPHIQYLFWKPVGFLPCRSDLSSSALSEQGEHTLNTACSLPCKAGVVLACFLDSVESWASAWLRMHPVEAAARLCLVGNPCSSYSCTDKIQLVALPGLHHSCLNLNIPQISL